MADQTVPVMYPNTASTTDGPIPADRQPAIKQETHPTTGPADPVPQVRHADDHDGATGNRGVRER